MARALLLGTVSAAVLVWATLFASAGAVEVSTLMAVVVAVIWFATVHPRRLVGSDGRPDLALFGLSALGLAVLVTGALVISTGTVYLVALLGLTGMITGVVRAVRRSMKLPGTEDADGVP